MKTFKLLTYTGLIGLGALATSQVFAGDYSGVNVTNVTRNIAISTGYKAKSGFKWNDSDETAAPSSKPSWSVNEPESVFKWKLEAGKQQSEAYTAGILQTTGAKTDIPSQTGFKWGVRSVADQAGFKWGVRSAADQAGFKWGVR